MLHTLTYLWFIFGLFACCFFFFYQRAFINCWVCAPERLTFSVTNRHASLLLLWDGLSRPLLHFLYSIYFPGVLISRPVYNDCRLPRNWLDWSIRALKQKLCTYIWKKSCCVFSNDRFYLCSNPLCVNWLWLQTPPDPWNKPFVESISGTT